MSFHGDFFRPAVLCRDHEHFRPHQISFTDSHLIDRPSTRREGNVDLPSVAARIPAAQSGLDLSCPCGSITCNARELACDLHYSQPNQAACGYRQH